MRSGHQIFTIEISGKNLACLDGEAGGHRIQRIPPTERKGRTHTSTVTVAVISKDAKGDTSQYLLRDKANFSLEWYNGTIRAGGQHHQKNATCCRLVHLPTGIVKTAQTRSRNNSETLARTAMIAELDQLVIQGDQQSINNLRKCQVGTGMRGDKRRTIRWQDDSVIDHVTGKRARTSEIMQGKFDLLWM